jgi:hypothetical protein
VVVLREQPAILLGPRGAILRCGLLLHVSTATARICWARIAQVSLIFYESQPRNPARVLRRRGIGARYCRWREAGPRQHPLY